MDPVTALGVAAAASQFAEQVLKLSDYLYDLFKSINNAPKQSRELRQEALLLSDVLANLRSLLSSEKQTASLPKASPSAELVKEFEETIAEIAKRVEIKDGEISWKRLGWPFNQKENEKYLSKLERYKSSFQLALHTLQSTKLAEIEFLVRRTDYTVQHVSQLSYDSSQYRREEKRLDVLKWIYPHEFDSRHKEVAQVRSKASGNWVLKSQVYQRWLKGASGPKILFCHGMPGSGKSVIMSRVVDELLSTESRTVAFIYFDYTDFESCEPENIIRSLLKQLLYKLRTLPEVIEKLHKECSEQGKPVDLSVLTENLKILIRTKFQQVTFLFDALDEVTTQHSKKVTAMLAELHLVGAKVFCTSRINTAKVREELGNPAVMEIVANSEDVINYLETRLGEEWIYDDENKQKIVNCLVKKAMGNFLLVRFQLDYVLGFAEPYDSIEALTTLPNDMETAYVQVLKRIEANRKPTVMKVLSWLFHARVQLHQDEVREAIAVRIGQTKLPKPLIHADVLVQYCHGLVVIDESTGIMRFSHFTVKEFLNTHYQEHLLSKIECGRVCLTYLAFNVFENGPCPSLIEYKNRLSEYRFGGYASQVWGSYIRGQGESDEGALVCLGKVLKSQKKCGAMLQMQGASSDRLNPFGPSRLNVVNLPVSPIEVATALHVMAAEGLSEIYSRLLTPESPINASDDFSALHILDVLSHDSSPLLWSSREGHSSMALLLIENGADVNASFDDGSTSLHAAARKGHDGVVKVLLEKGAKVNVKDLGGATPLYTAAAGGHHKAARLLLENGAIVNERDSHGLTPLHMAARFGGLKMVKLLLSKGAEVNARGSFYVSGNFGLAPLHVAAVFKQGDLVEPLLNMGGELEGRDDWGRTALHCAAGSGAHEVIKILLHRGARINVRDRDGNTPLHRAARRQAFEAVKVLLDNGANVNKRNWGRTTALDAADRTGNSQIRNLLLTSGAVNANDWIACQEHRWCMSIPPEQQ